MLPQTAFKLWGLKEPLDANFLQFQIPARHSTANYFETAAYRVNCMILEILGKSFNNTVNMLDDTRLTDSLIDMHILNLSHQFACRFNGPLNVIDYANSGQTNVRYNEIVYSKEFSRALVRNYRISKKHQIKTMYHLTYEGDRIFNTVDIFWKNKFLDLGLVKQRSKAFISTYSKELPELRSLSAGGSVLLVNPPFDFSEDEFSFWVLELFNKYQDLTQFDNYLVKQHRFASNIFPKEMRIGGKRFCNISSSIGRAVPIEVFLLGFPSWHLLSPPSSCIGATQNVILAGPFREEERKAYQLMLYRMGKSNSIRTVYA
jgi:hypothetical protein